MDGTLSPDESGEDRFFLPASYVPNSVNVTLDAVSGDEYWDAHRVALSSRYQWGAYVLAAELAAERRARRVVDVGCGVATKLVSCFDPEQFELIGIDQAPAVAACERLERPGRYFADDFENPSDDVRTEVAPADIVISSDVIEHLLDPDVLVDYLRSVVSPDGVIVITTPDRLSLCGDVDYPSNVAHVREWSRPELTRYLESRGLVVDTSTLLTPFRYRPDRMTLAWLARRLRGRRPHKTCHMVVCRPA
jgi:SAM-dependent methyltransferase